MSRSLTAFPVVADPSVVDGLLPAMAAALEGSGPAILPVPATDAGLRASLITAMRPDDPTAPLESEGIAVVIATSGSSGRPKGVLLSVSALTWAADALHRLIGGPGTWLLALPAWHIGGLQVITRSLEAGTAPVAMDLTKPFAAEAFVEATRAVQARAGGEPTYASIVPTQLTRLLDAGGAAVEALASYDAILVGSAATPEALAARARAAGARILLSYGMSETTGGCCYDGWPLDGLTVRLRSEDDRILVQGPTTFSGYRLAPAMTAETLVDGWVVAPDVGRLEPDGRLTVLGRADDLIVSGGEKVSPLAVAACLRSHPAVADVEVLGVPDPEWGQAVVAFVVLTDPSHAVDEATAREHVRASLGRAAAPRRVVVVDALPMLASGKVDRAALQGLARQPGEGRD